LEASLVSRPAVTPAETIPFDQVFDTYYPAVFRYFRYRGADADTANDLASSVFEKALSNLRRYDPHKGQIQTWLFAIAHNLAINHWKTGATHPTTSLDDLDQQAQDDPPPEEELVRIQDKQEILRALQSLDPRSIEIIALKFGGSLTNSQIAELVNLNESNVGVILYRSLLKLRTVLTPSQAEVSHE
jgi:RNA polymerase sigma-70 factor (ECF subfamily)